LVVFDEASQVRPVEAFGAIMRGKQVVVVGDNKQLPPTSFFDALLDTDEVDEDNLTTDMESILGLFAARGAPERMLRWHYRSRHESLISVSNHEFYENRLVIFPSPDKEQGDLGLIYHHLPDTAYDRGGTRSNVGEAKSVAEAVMEHARKRPELTLGVAAFSTAQMQAIQDQLELLRRKDPSCESFFAAHPFEPFFVKNLENVQGDERDVIFISIGYGRTAQGYLSMSFGPLNLDGGERRLNVLITRARRSCQVFTNLTADDIDLARSNARGVRALKTFLQYAHSGRLDVPEATGREPDSPFEESVLSTLRSVGYQVETQVGSAGFFIDLAVIDPETPGRYLLGIECDGATYHSARSARDRDRLRQEVLEGLGWRIHRIWSTDWFRNPEKELKRTVEAIEEAKFYIGSQKEQSDQSKSTDIMRDMKPDPITVPDIP
jgi:very-short-patch-repair endonuclease